MEVRYYRQLYLKTKRPSGLFPKRLASKKISARSNHYFFDQHISHVRLKTAPWCPSVDHLLSADNQRRDPVLPRCCATNRVHPQQILTVPFFFLCFAKMKTSPMKCKSDLFCLGKTQLKNE